MNSPFLSIGLTLALLAPAAAQSRVKLDVMKVTCRRASFVGSIASTHSLALWLAGYYSAKHDMTAVDITSLDVQARKIMEYCRKNRDEPLMDAVGAALRD